MVEQTDWYLIIMTIITCLIAIVNLIIGCKEAKEGLPSFPWNQKEEEPKKADPEANRAKSYVINDGYTVPNQESNIKDLTNNNLKYY